MKNKLYSLRFRILLPMIIAALFVVTVLNATFSRVFTDMIMKQEQDLNAVGFELVSSSVMPLIDSSIREVTISRQTTICIPPYVVVDK